MTHPDRTLQLQNATWLRAIQLNSAFVYKRSCVPFPGRTVLLGFFYEILSSSEFMCARVMEIRSPPIIWDLKHTGELWVYIRYA